MLGRVAVSGHREYNPGWHTALDLKNLLTVAEAVVRSALDRRESRGLGPNAPPWSPDRLCRPGWW